MPEDKEKDKDKDKDKDKEKEPEPPADWRGKKGSLTRPKTKNRLGE